ncbi:MAG: FAD-dependent oxidoreductase, partial [Pseudomonadales bacterium]
IAETFSNCHWLLKADAATLSSVAGRTIGTSGLWFPRSGWLDLHGACECLLTHPGISRIVDHATGVRHDDGWRILTASGEAVESGQLVIAAGPLANTFAPTSALPLATVAGQITSFHCRNHGLRCVVSGDGYVAPLASHHLVAGATYVREGYEGLPDAAGRDSNRARLHSMLGDVRKVAFAVDFAALRTTSRDRRPFVGTLSPGLHVSIAHASHGALMAPLAGEIIASGIDREAPPLDAQELELLNPRR